MPAPLNDHVRRRMEGQRTAGTKAELAVRSALHACGLRFRVDYRPAPGIRTRADIVFTRVKVAVYIDGCFWHGCPVHFSPPKNNADWWAEKIGANVDRDARNSNALRVAGWVVLRFWEHEERDDVVRHIVSAVGAARGGGGRGDDVPHGSK